MKTAKILFPILIVASIIIWWGITYYSSNGETLPPLHTETVEIGDVSQRVTAYGALQPIQKVTVGSQVSGIIDEIYVDFNSRVERGDVMAQIDPSTFKAEVSSAQAELESAEAGLQLAQMQYDRVQELRERQFIAPSEVDQASSTLR